MRRSPYFDTLLSVPVLRYAVSRCHESRALGVNKHPPRPEPELQSWAGSGVSLSLCCPDS